MALEMIILHDLLNGDLLVHDLPRNTNLTGFRICRLVSALAHSCSLALWLMALTPESLLDTSRLVWRVCHPLTIEFV